MTNPRRATLVLLLFIILSAGISTIPAVSAANPSSYMYNGFVRPTANNPITLFTNIFMPLLDPPLNLVVTSTADPGDGVCDAICTLREAMNDANIAPDVNTISFNFDTTNGGPYIIQPLTPLPLISYPVIINGRSQPDYPGRPIVEINGVHVADPYPPANVGINIIGGGTTVRGLAINGFAYGGIGIIFGSNNTIWGNFIGTDVTGNIAIPNLYGVIIYQSSNNLVGGIQFDQFNLISGNLDDGINIGHASSTGNKIIGNLIGGNLGGNALLGNHDKGIKVEDAVNTTIGGTQPYEGNTIVASGLYGVFLKDTSGNVVVGNWIGTNSAGDNLGNTNHGIFLQGASNTTIGGTQPGAGNVIAFNTGAGVDVEPFTLPDPPNTTYFAVKNAIMGNSIHDNSTLGIDLGSNGLSANDAGDGDTGPNNLQNFPVLTSATTTGTSVTFSGTLNSQASKSYRIEFFDSPTCDSSGNGEGQTYLGSGQATTNASGNATFNVTLNTFVLVGDSITATATDPLGNTSEFSSCTPAASQTNASPSRNYFTTLTPTLTWNAVVGAIGYEVEVSTNSTFSGMPIVDDNTLTPDLLSYTVTLPQDGVYYWRVRAQLANGVWNPIWSATETITVAS